MAKKKAEKKEKVNPFVKMDKETLLIKRVELKEKIARLNQQKKDDVEINEIKEDIEKLQAHEETEKINQLNALIAEKQAELQAEIDSQLDPDSIQEKEQELKEAEKDLKKSLKDTRADLKLCEEVLTVLGKELKKNKKS